MLSAFQIEALRLMSEQLLDPITNFLIEDIAKRISEAGQLTATASYQVWRAQNLGISQRKLKKELQKRLKVSQEEVERLLTQAAETGYNFDISRFPTTHAIPLAANSSLQQILEATVKLAQEDLTNITQTMGFVGSDGVCRELTQAYQQACDFAFQKVSAGAQDYISAVREATKNLVDKGIRTIDYESGVHTSVEAAVRRNIMGGLGLMQEQISEKNHDLLGCDGWEISAHAASAPDHEPFQGKQYSDEEYTQLNNSLVRRIGTLNCGHAASPIILGVSSPQFTDEELEQFRRDNEAGVDFDGKHYTMYEATQRQRKFERSIRKQKQRILADEALDDKDKLQNDQIRLVRLQDEYRRFSKGTGLRTQHARMEMSGFGPKQAKAAEKVALGIRHNSDDVNQIFKKNSDFKNKDGTFDLDAAKKEYSNFLTSVPEKNKIYLQQSANAVSYRRGNSEDSPFSYSGANDEVVYNPDNPEFWKYSYCEANTHELSHRIDYFFADSSNSEELANAIAVAANVVALDSGKYADYCWEHADNAFLSDIIDALSEGTLTLPAGHGHEYWTGEKGKAHKCKEIFANTFSLEALGQNDCLAFVKSNFPEIYTAYINLL